MVVLRRLTCWTLAALAAPAIAPLAAQAQGPALAAAQGNYTAEATPMPAARRAAYSKPLLNSLFDARPASATTSAPTPATPIASRVAMTQAAPAPTAAPAAPPVADAAANVGVIANNAADSVENQPWSDHWTDTTWDDCCPGPWSHWTVNLDAIFWRRSTPDDLPLAASGGPANASNLTFDTEAGPRLALIRRGISGWDLEANYTGMEGWQSRLHLPTAVDPRIPSDNPGGLFLSSVGVPATGLDVFYQSHLYNEELNLRHELNSTWTALVGFRAMQIYERFDMNAGAVPAPLLSIEAENRLYGFQIGGEGKLWTTERFELSTLLKAGLFENNSEQSTADLAGGLSGSTPPYRLTASTNQASFIGEIGLNGRYRIGESILLRAGYNVMWVDDVTLASEQLNVNEFQSFAPPPDTALRGITAKDSLFIHGASVGFELTW